MTTAKARYEPQIGEQVDDITFDEAQIALLRSIKDDDSFVDAIRHIAELYGCLCRSEPYDLSTGEFRATLEDLKRGAASLTKKLENLPQGVDVALWRFSYKKDSPPNMDNLKALLNSLTNEIEKALDEESGTGKPGRKPATSNWYAANSLVRCFKSYGLPVTINQWEDSTMAPITSCLQLIFASSDRHLSRSAIEEYLKTPKGKNYS